MKILAFSALLLTGLGLMSFSAGPNTGVDRIGSTLYHVDATSRLNDADLNFILETVAAQYKLGDYRMVEGSIELEPIAGRKKGNWIIRRKLFLSWLDENFITWETVPAEAATQVAKLDAVIAKYTPSGK